MGSGVVTAVDGSERDLDIEDPELDEVDFFLLSPGFTIAIWAGFDESAITTLAIIGPRTLACSDGVFLLFLSSPLELSFDALET